MSKGYRPYLPDQDLLLPPSLQEWLPEGHLVYFVSDVVNQLDLSAVHAVYGEEKRGQPPYDPRLMIKLLVYGYCTGVFSSRRIQKRLQEDIPFRVLAAGNDPDFRTISDFRKIHIATLQNLFEQVLEMALESGAVKLGRVSVDGTKVKANASKHKAMSYGRMQEKKKKTGGTATSEATNCPMSCGGGRRSWPRSSWPRRLSSNGHGRRQRQRVRMQPRRRRRSQGKRISTTSPIRSRAS